MTKRRAQTMREDMTYVDNMVNIMITKDLKKEVI